MIKVELKNIRSNSRNLDLETDLMNTAAEGILSTISNDLQNRMCTTHPNQVSILTIVPKKTSNLFSINRNSVALNLQIQLKLISNYKRGFAFRYLAFLTAYFL